MTKQYDNFADLITFTRASTGTYLDSDGLLKTATTNTPRIEYDINGNRKGILIEEARTNTMIRSEEFDNAQWVTTVAGNGLAPVVTANQAIAPDGNLTADRIVFDAVDGSGESSINNLSATGLTGVCTGSVWLKAESGTPTVRVRIDWSGGSYGENFVLTNEWQRYVVTMPSANSGATGVNRLTIRTRPALGTSISATVYFWGAQLEAGSFPTSYISTAGSTATRAADVASIPTSAFGYNADKGTVVVDFEYQFDTTGGFPRPWELGSTSTAVNRINVFTSGASGNLTAAARANDASVASFILLSAAPSPVGGKAAFAFAENDFAACIDGGSVQTDTDGTMAPSVPRNELAIGGAVASTTANINGHLKSIRYWPRRLTNAQLQEITS